MIRLLTNVQPTGENLSKKIYIPTVCSAPIKRPPQLTGPCPWRGCHQRCSRSSPRRGPRELLLSALDEPDY